MAGNGHLDGRVVVITGGAGGFGRLLASGASARGAKVVVSDVDRDGIAGVVAGVREQGGDALGVVADVTKLDEMHALIAAAVEEFGAVDVMVNNAGVMPLAFIADHEQAAPAWDRCIDINIKGVLHGMVAAHDQMIAQGRGHVVNLSSIYGNAPVAGAAVYGASKAAVNTMSEAFRVESQGKIKVTIVRPTGVPDTGLGGGVVNPEAIAGILGQNLDEYLPVIMGDRSPAQQDRDDVQFAVLPPEDLVAQILYAIDQPWGVSIGDITVRAAGDRYVL
ncbi:MAG: SDR family NAD(P)-dependent oxidoreductase [Acidimicrobiales bacterium]|nr:SDR family NAD(P)-dependent oxidoreductase [Acidimicrobiales bacterium]